MKVKDAEESSNNNSVDSVESIDVRNHKSRSDSNTHKLNIKNNTKVEKLSSPYDFNLKENTATIVNSIQKKYKLENLTRTEKLNSEYNRCGICLDYFILSKPSNVVFCCGCESATHYSCLNKTLSVDKELINLDKIETSCYKTWYAPKLLFDYTMTCEKCLDPMKK